jgi:hypothetical protein
MYVISYAQPVRASPTCVEDRDEQGISIGEGQQAAITAGDKVPTLACNRHTKKTVVLQVIRWAGQDSNLRLED